MLFTIPQVLTPAELANIRAVLGSAEFVDGKLTAGWHAKLVKNNQQLTAKTSKANSLKQQVKKALNNHPLVQTGIRPKTIHTIPDHNDNNDGVVVGTIRTLFSFQFAT